MKQLKAPLDFSSRHSYKSDPHYINDKIQRVRDLLDKYEFTSTESILNEWNYVPGCISIASEFHVGETT